MDKSFIREKRIEYNVCLTDFLIRGNDKPYLSVALFTPSMNIWLAQFCSILGYYAEVFVYSSWELRLATCRTTKAMLLLLDEEEQRNFLLRKTQTFAKITTHEACFGLLTRSIQPFVSMYTNK